MERGRAGFVASLEWAKHAAELDAGEGPAPLIIVLHGAGGRPEPWIEVAARTGIAAATIRRISAELAHLAFEREVVIEQPWTDAWGRQHERMVGRPVGPW